MDVDHLDGLIAAILELVPGAGRDDYDFAAPDLMRLVIYDDLYLPFEQDKRLFIRVAMLFGSLSR
jgi:hypothetical protein